MNKAYKKAKANVEALKTDNKEAASAKARMAKMIGNCPIFSMFLAIVFIHFCLRGFIL